MTTDWDELLADSLLGGLRQLIARRTGIEVGVATPDGELRCSSPELARCVPSLLPTLLECVDGDYHCAVHDRVERCLPVVAAGQPIAALFYPRQPFAGEPPLTRHDATLVDELCELIADEILRATASDLPIAVTPPPPASRYNMIGTSRPLEQLFRLLDKVCVTDSTVLITGENGTGKELIARAIHYNSDRKDERFVTQNCSAFNDNLLDSELFGHKRGAFTGAVVDKPGLFEVADRGTFFLDEIGDMSPVLQVKVLRVLQEGTFTPVGDTVTRQVDVRILAATNRDLKQMVERGEFREDLYYRIHVINLQVPALRERREDIPLLVDFFLERIATQKRARQKRVLPAALARMLEYAWPGNVRELENEIERLVVLSGDQRLIDETLLSPRILEASAPRRDALERASLPEAVDELERNLIVEVLQRTQWNKTRAAAELQISRRNLIRKCQKYNLHAPD